MKYTTSQMQQFPWDRAIGGDMELAVAALTYVMNHLKDNGFSIAKCAHCGKMPIVFNINDKKHFAFGCQDNNNFVYISRNETLFDLTNRWNKTQDNLCNGPKSLDELLEQKPDDGEPLTKSQKLIAEVCDAVKSLLLEKNRKYGDSALNPCRIFAKSDSEEQIKVRIDDKLNRIRNEQGDEDEDVVQDLIGYLVLLRCARKMKQEASR